MSHSLSSARGRAVSYLRWSTLMTSMGLSAKDKSMQLSPPARSFGPRPREASSTNARMPSGFEANSTSASTGPEARWAGPVRPVVDDDAAADEEEEEPLILALTQAARKEATEERRTCVWMLTGTGVDEDGWRKCEGGQRMVC